MRFSDVFEAVAHKRLAKVDLPALGSHQHELNGVAALRAFFGVDGETSGVITWTRFADDAEPASEVEGFKFYDARAKSAARTGRSPEWRLYYTGNPLDQADIGDLVVMAKTVEGGLCALVFEKDSGWERAALQLFPAMSDTGKLDVVGDQELARTDVDLVRRAIIERLGLEHLLPASSRLSDLVFERFGLAFPKTRDMGELARELVGDDSRDADELLLEWIDTEEQLFRALENLIVGERIELGFSNIDDFLSFSLSVQNRRKSRMGHAFEHHLKALFVLLEVPFSAQVRTEGNRTADFIFPGISEYRDPGFPDNQLRMLGAKSTCKDRWAQVLADADRIKVKHLGTLDSALSSYQLADMAAKLIVPVMPSRIRSGYSSVPGADSILSVADFVSLVR